MPTISIIVPIYNVEKYLSDCLYSIEKQTYSDFECILINDGSTDNSQKTCESFLKKDNRFVLINKKNTGVSDTRNYGINIAKGKFLIFIDSDDYIHPQMLSILHYNLIKHPECSFSMIKERVVFSSNTNYETYNENEIDTFIISQKELIKSIYNQSNKISELTSVVVWNKLYRREAINNIRFIKTGTEDTEFNNKILLNSKYAIYINLPLYYLRERQDSITSKPFNNWHIERINSYKSCLNNIPFNFTYYRGLCLEKLYKTILNVRHYSVNTTLSNKAYNTIIKIKQETFTEFLYTFNIPIHRKCIILLFLYIPYTYTIFLKFMEYKNKK